MPEHAAFKHLMHYILTHPNDSVNQKAAQSYRLP